MNFSTVAQCFEAIEQVSGRLVITELLADLLHDLSAQEAKIVSYLVQGSLLPAYKNVQFQIAKKGMAEIIAQLVETSLVDVVADQKEKATEKTSGTKTTKGSQQQNITIKKKSTPDVKAPQMIREETDKAVEETKNRDTQKENIHKATGLAD